MADPGDGIVMRVLGGVHVEGLNRSLTPAQELLLGALAVRGGTVSAGLLGELLWPGAPPQRPTAALGAHIARLRELVAHTGATIERESLGYRLVVAPGGLDVAEFERLAQRGVALAAQDPAAGVELLAEALELWRGSPPPALAEHAVLRGELYRLEELWLSTLEARIAVEISLGEGHQVVAELHRLVDDHPLHEGLVRLLLLALAAADRVEEALARFETTRGILLDELGSEPSPELEAVRQELLGAVDPAAIAHAATAHRPDADRAPDEIEPSLPVRPGEWERALRAFHAAATEAERTFDNTGALAHLERVVDLWVRVPDAESLVGEELAEVLLRAARLALLVGRTALAVELAYRSIEQPASDDQSRARRHLVLAAALRHGHDPVGEAGLVVARALELTAGERTAVAARALVAGAWQWTHDPGTAARLGDRAIELAELVDAPEVLGEALVMAGTAEAMLGEPGIGLEMVLHGRSLSEQCGDRFGMLDSYVTLATMHLFAGRPAEAADIALNGLTRARPGADEALFREACRVHALAGLTLSGRWLEIDGLTSPAGSEGRFAGLGRVYQAWFGALRGEFAEARSTLDALAGSDVSRDPLFDVAESWLALCRNEPTRLRHAAMRGLRRTRPTAAAVVNELVFLAVVGIVGEVRRAGPRPSAQREVDTVLEQLRENPGGMPTATAWALSARAAAGDLASGSVELWRAAVEAWGRIDGWPHVQIYVRCRLAVANGGGVEGAELLAMARDQSTRLGSDPLERLVRSAEASLGLDPSGGLTPREREVLGLIAHGATNRVIASRLAISEKTASVHVSNLLRKLGASSRTEAALIASRLR